MIRFRIDFSKKIEHPYFRLFFDGNIFTNNVKKFETLYKIVHKFF